MKFDSLQVELAREKKLYDCMKGVAKQYAKQLLEVKQELAQKILEVESLKNKIVEKPEPPKIVHAKTAAEVRRFMEQENERELEEVNGI